MRVNDPFRALSQTLRDGSEAALDPGRRGLALGSIERMADSIHDKIKRDLRTGRWGIRSKSGKLENSIEYRVSEKRVRGKMSYYIQWDIMSRAKNDAETERFDSGGKFNYGLFHDSFEVPTRYQKSNYYPWLSKSVEEYMRLGRDISSIAQLAGQDVANAFSTRIGGKARGQRDNWSYVYGLGI